MATPGAGENGRSSFQLFRRNFNAFDAPMDMNEMNICTCTVQYTQLQRRASCGI